MNALSLTASAVGIFTVSTSPNLAQEIRTPFGILHMGMNIVEAESALGTKPYHTDPGAIFLQSNFNGQKYFVSFKCPDRISRCDKEAMKPMTIDVIYTNEISFDIRPREVTKVLENFGFDNVKVRYDTNCAFWNTETTIMNAGRLCSGWGIRMRNRKIPWGFDRVGLGGFTPCTAGCF